MGEDGVITNAKRANFVTEMTVIRENLDMKKAPFQLDKNLENLGTSFSNPITKEIADKFDKTLIFEIGYYRSLAGALSISKEMNIDSSISYNYTTKFYKLNPDEFISDLYYIDEETANGKKETYIYDAKCDVAFKIVNTKIGKNVVHSLEYFNYLLNHEEIKINNPDMYANEGDFDSVRENGVKYYSPNYKNFTVNGTYVVYFDKSDYTDIEKVLQVPIAEFTGEREITKDGKEYVLYDYENQVWANIVTKNASKEAWWVWIPRYSYSDIDKTNFTNINITFVDTSTPASPSFTVDGQELQGIWVSKYEPVVSFASGNNMLPYYFPDMTGFDAENTYIEIYDEETNTFKEEVKLSSIGDNLKKFCNDNLWFNYDKKIWANIKTVANGEEAWWVWIPRYAYTIMGNQTDIKFVDVYNTPIDGTELENYIVHSAFTVTKDDGTKQELKGIWVSKYEPVEAESHMVEQNVNAPDLIGYNVNNTSIQIYNSDGTGVLGEISLNKIVKSSNVTNNILTNGGIDSSLLEQEINKLGTGATWYNYNKKIWANIKTVANGEEAYWTWIPRYAYAIIGTSTDIVFINKNNQSLTTGVEVMPNMIPHSAFTIISSDGSKKELDGIWVSKYEPTGNTSSTLNVSDGDSSQ